MTDSGMAEYLATKPPLQHLNLNRTSVTQAIIPHLKGKILGILHFQFFIFFNHCIKCFKGGIRKVTPMTLLLYRNEVLSPHLLSGPAHLIFLVAFLPLTLQSQVPIPQLCQLGEVHYITWVSNWLVHMLSDSDTVALTTWLCALQFN